MAHQKKEMETLNIRIPATLKDFMERYVAMDCHVNISDFAREAIREKIKRDAPQFYKQLKEEIEA